MNLFPNEGFKASLLEVPANPSALTSVQNVSHGEVRYCIVHSALLDAARPLLVYTPPGYETSGKKYPVFYLVSGTTDTEETWFKVGKVNVILDNLIAQGKAVPMIVVMPYGNMMNGTPGPTTPQAAEMYKDFGEELTRTIMPYVESTFRTIPNRKSRAIAGFSRGGGQSLFTGLNHLELFSNIGSYSAYLTPQVVDAYFSGIVSNPQKLNAQLDVFWLGVGSSDFLYKDAVTFMDLLRNKGVNYSNLITEGGHTWMNARHYLIETLQLYFKK
jgi:enterochelin esterase-like enzyme